MSSVLTNDEKNELWRMAERDMPCNGSRCFRSDGDTIHSGDCSANRQGAQYLSLVRVAEKFKKA